MHHATRNQMYAAIYAFERDIRSIFSRYIGWNENLQEVFSPDELRMATERARDDYEDWGDFDDAPAPKLIEYLDLRPSYDLLNRHLQSLPEPLAKEIRANTARLDTLVPIRKRLMHARPLAPEDQERLISSLVCFSHPQWAETRKALESLKDPNWEPEIAIPKESEKVLHNLPVADYDETGLIGRNAQVERLVAMLAHGRDSVVTLTGEGGIGKTALALEVAYKLADLPEYPFEAIWWVTLKQERLTGNGVAQIKDAIVSMSAAADHLGKNLDPNFRGSLSDLADLIGNIPTLICIDNIESVGGLEFIELYETLPDSVKYFLTSRRGIGQIERRIPVDPLGESDALQLLSVFSRTRHTPTIQKLSKGAKKQIVEALRYSPLAIRWWVLATAAGRPPADLIHDQSELLTFCLKSVFDSLSPSAARLAIALDVLSGEASLHRLVHITNDTLDEASIAMHELFQSSIVNYSVDYEGDLETYVSLTDTARKYLRMSVPADHEIRIMVRENDVEYREHEEQRERDIHDRLLNPVVVRHRSNRDIPTCHILRRAINVSKKGDVPQALADIERARVMSPDFWEVDRVEAFIRSFVDPAGQVSAIYHTALEKCETPEHKAICSYFFAGHLARNAKDLVQSLRYARVAHETLQVDDTANSLANAQIRMGDFDEGIPLLESVARSSTGRLKMISWTALVGGYSRWAEHADTANHNILDAIRFSKRGIDEGAAALAAGYHDQRLIAATVDSLSLFLGYCNRIGSAGVPEWAAQWPVTLDDYMVVLRSSDSWKYVERKISLGGRALLESVCLPVGLMAGAEEGGEAANGEKYSGTIFSVNGTFGFISHPKFPRNVFFPGSALVGFSMSDIDEGSSVEFLAEWDDSRESWRATRVTFPSSNTN